MNTMGAVVTAVVVVAEDAHSVEQTVCRTNTRMNKQTGHVCVCV